MVKVRRLDSPTQAPVDKYPYLGRNINDGELIVFFYKKLKGIVVHPGYGWEIGHKCTSWHEPAFVPYDGEICLSND